LHVSKLFVQLIEGSDVGMTREEEEYVYMELCVMRFFFGVEYVCQNFRDSLNVGGAGDRRVA